MRAWLLALGLAVAALPAAAATPYEQGQAAAAAGDYQAAIEAYRAGMLADDPQSTTALAGLYFQGKGVDRDAARAESLLLEAAAGGYDTAAFLLARLYAGGGLGTANPERAEHLLRGLAGKGYPAAALELSMLLYEHGKGEKAATEAAEFAEQAARAGMPDAQYHYGMLFRRGHGVPQSDDQAYLWVFMSAQAGFANAQGVVRELLDRLGAGRAMAMEREATRLWTDGEVAVPKEKPARR